MRGVPTQEQRGKQPLRAQGMPGLFLFPFFLLKLLFFFFFPKKKKKGVSWDASVKLSYFSKLFN